MIKKAFTLLELIIYVAITSVIVVSLTLFSLKMVEARGDGKMDREVLENAEFILNDIVYELHDAVSVNTGGFGSHPGSLTLDLDLGGTKTFDTDTKVVGNQTIRYLQIDGVQATSDYVNVTNFVFSDLTRDVERSNIQLEMTVESLDGMHSLDVRTSVSLRE